ncbi:unnamed protein product [Sphacelaria rigidula]
MHVFLDVLNVNPSIARVAHLDHTFFLQVKLKSIQRSTYSRCRRVDPLTVRDSRSLVEKASISPEKYMHDSVVGFNPLTFDRRSFPFVESALFLVIFQVKTIPRNGHLGRSESRILALTLRPRD